MTRYCRVAIYRSRRGDELTIAVAKLVSPYYKDVTTAVYAPPVSCNQLQVGRLGRACSADRTWNRINFLLYCVHASSAHIIVIAFTRVFSRESVNHLSAQHDCVYVILIIIF